MSLSPALHFKRSPEVLHSPSPPCAQGWETKTHYLLFVARPREPRNFTSAAAGPRKPAFHPPGSAGRGLLSGIRARRLCLRRRRRTRSRPAGRSRCPRPAQPALRQAIASSRLSRRAWPHARTPRRRPAPLPPRPASGTVWAPPPLGRRHAPVHTARSLGAGGGCRVPRETGEAGPQPAPGAPDNNEPARARPAGRGLLKPGNPVTQGWWHMQVGTKLGPEGGCGPGEAVREEEKGISHGGHTHTKNLQKNLTL